MNLSALFKNWKSNDIVWMSNKDLHELIRYKIENENPESSFEVKLETLGERIVDSFKRLVR